MLAWPRSLPLLLLALAACPGEADESTTGASSSTAPATTDASSSSSSTGEPTTGGSEGVTTGADACAERPAGDWVACVEDGQTNNTLCGYEPAGSSEGKVTCLSPQSGNFNVCGIRDCVDDCDCFAPPTTGTAIATCTVVFGGGGKACVLYCVNGQICPDGMECASGTCYWPS